jgi:uncharacterized membrane protein
MHILNYFIIKIWGTSELILRMPAAIFGIMSIIAIYFLSRRLFSWREGVYVAAFIAFMYPPVYFSQEARMYSMLVFFIIVNGYFLSGIVQSDKDRVWTKEFSGYVLSAFLAGGTHYFGLLLISVQSLWLLWNAVVDRRFIGCKLKQVLITHIVLLPIYCLAIYQFMHNRVIVSWIEPCSWSRGWWHLKYLFYGFPLLFIVFIGLLCYLFIFCMFSKKKRFIVSHELWLFVWLFVPVLLTIAASKICGIHLFTPRNLLVVMPAAYMILARGIVVVPISNWIKDCCVIGVCFVIIATLFVNDGYRTPHKIQYKEAVAFIDRSFNVDEDKLALSGTDQGLFDYYKTNPKIKAAIIFQTFNIDDMVRLTDSGRKNIVVGWFWFYPDKEMLMKITDHFTILERLDFRNVIVMKLALKETS